MFKYFTDISVYNERTKKFIRLDKNNAKKISVNGCPRIKDFISKKKYYKQPRTILFLAFDVRRGITKTKNNSHLNFNLSFNTVVKMLNNLANNKKLKIIIKYKHNLVIKLIIKLVKKLKYLKLAH